MSSTTKNEPRDSGRGKLSFPSRASREDKGRGRGLGEGTRNTAFRSGLERGSERGVRGRGQRVKPTGSGSSSSREPNSRVMEEEKEKWSRNPYMYKRVKKISRDQILMNFKKGLVPPTTNEDVEALSEIWSKEPLDPEFMKYDTQVVYADYLVQPKVHRPVKAHTSNQVGTNQNLAYANQGNSQSRSRYTDSRRQNDRYADGDHERARDNGNPDLIWDDPSDAISAENPWGLEMPQNKQDLFAGLDLGEEKDSSPQIEEDPLKEKGAQEISSSSQSQTTEELTNELLSHLKAGEVKQKEEKDKKDLEERIKRETEEMERYGDMKPSWSYRDLQGIIQGPFSSYQMDVWNAEGQLMPELMISFDNSNRFLTLREMLRVVKSAQNCQDSTHFFLAAEKYFMSIPGNRDRSKSHGKRSAGIGSGGLMSPAGNNVASRGTPTTGGILDSNLSTAKQGDSSQTEGQNLENLFMQLDNQQQIARQNHHNQQQQDSLLGHKASPQVGTNPTTTTSTSDDHSTALLPQDHTAQKLINPTQSTQQQHSTTTTAEPKESIEKLSEDLFGLLRIGSSSSTDTTHTTQSKTKPNNDDVSTTKKSQARKQKKKHTNPHTIDQIEAMAGKKSSSSSVGGGGDNKQGGKAKKVIENDPVLDFFNSQFEDPAIQSVTKATTATTAAVAGAGVTKSGNPVVFSQSDFPSLGDSLDGDPAAIVVASGDSGSTSLKKSAGGKAQKIQEGGNKKNKKSGDGASTTATVTTTKGQDGSQKKKHAASKSSNGGNEEKKSQEKKKDASGKNQNKPEQKKCDDTSELKFLLGL